MRIETKHNPEIFKTENLERWDRIWKEKVINHNIYLFASIVFLIIAIGLVKNDNPTGYLFFSIGLFGLVVSINFLKQTKRMKNEYLSQIDKISDRHQKSNTSISWELTNDYIHYEDFQMSLKLNWQAFSHYYIKYNSIFLVAHDTNNSPISINKSEVNETEYSDLIIFIGSKLKSGKQPSQK